MNPTTPRRPAFDPELASSLAAARLPELDFAPDALIRFQGEITERGNQMRAEAEAAGYVVEDLQATAPDGHAIALVHLKAPAARPTRPCIYYIHGGGMILGSPWDGLEHFISWINDFGVSVVTVDHRLAPAVQAPTLVEDCYAGLRHVHAQAAQLGIDPHSIVIAGMSAGGGLAAGTALLARDRHDPPLLGQLLMAPMLDPDGDGDSVHQEPYGPWSPVENQQAWSLVLDGVAPDQVGANAPGRAECLGGLPPALLEVGSAETFRSEVIDYANRIWRTGGSAELHVWSGGFHGFEGFPHAAVAQAALDSRRNWLGRLFGYGPTEVNRN